MAFVGRICYGAISVLFLLLGKISYAEPVRVLLPPVCSLKSVKDFTFPLPHDVCPVGGEDFSYTRGVIEGDEVTLQKALHIIYESERDYVALLFYSSWCPFSRSFRPSFSVLSSIFPSIPHFAIEESVVRPSILSRYAVHGFPVLFLLNSTVRMRYHGSRTLDSLVSFYDESTGIKTSSGDGVCLDKMGYSGYDEKLRSYQENCPFPWARSPENLFQQETCLTLATLFVILRLLYFTFPALQRCAQVAWRWCVTNMSSRSLWEQPAVYLNQVIHLCNFLKSHARKVICRKERKMPWHGRPSL